MTEYPENLDPSLARVDAALRDLRTEAPASLVGLTLVAVGLEDLYAQLDTVIGPVWVAWNGRGVSAVTAAADADAFEAGFRTDNKRPIRRADEGIPERLATAIQRRLAGDRRVRVQVNLRGQTPFEKAVLRKALEIPRGEVRPYSWVAAEIGRPAAVRAVGTALGHNPVPLVIPCHRVVRSDGHIGQYSLGGPANKRTLIAAEGLAPDGLEEMARAGVRYIASDTTHVVCLPSCHQARRVTDRHRVPFGRLSDAVAAGFRPCRKCRPAAAVAA